MLERNANTRRADIRRTLLQQLRHLSVIGSIAAQTRPDLARSFIAPRRHAPHRAMLTDARQMLAAALKENELMLQSGIGDGFSDDLSRSIEEYDSRTTEAHDGRVGHVGARADLQASTEDCMTMIEGLDLPIRNRYVTNADALAAWTSARHIDGPFRRRSDGTSTDPKAAA